MNRRRFLSKVVAVTGGLATVKALEQTPSAMDCTTKVRLGHDALVCKGCELNDRHTYCVICGSHVCTDREAYERARVCNTCDKKGDICAYCGNFVGNSTMKARVCPKCSYNHYWDCYKCGSSTGPELG